MVSTMAGRAGRTASMLAGRQDRWAEVDCSDDLFYAYVGLLGRKAAAPRIAASALKYGTPLVRRTVAGQATS